MNAFILNCYSYVFVAEQGGSLSSPGPTPVSFVRGKPSVVTNNQWIEESF